MNVNEQMMLATAHKEYYGKLVVWCRKLINHDPELVDSVEDWVQEAFCRALVADDLPTHANMYGWFLVTCTHIAKNAIQRKGVRHKHLSTQLDAPEALPAADQQASVVTRIDNEDKRQLLNEIVKALTPTEAEVFQGVFVAEDKAESVAKQKGKQVSAIKATIRRIRKKARHIREKNKYQFFLLLMVSFYLLCS